jgi:hypothetical protein
MTAQPVTAAKDFTYPWRAAQGAAGRAQPRTT